MTTTSTISATTRDERIYVEAAECVRSGTGTTRLSGSRGEPCSLVRVGDEYVMFQRHARHTLQVSATDEARLAAHWAIFVA
jgi:hypothetical protein